jgi:hypothetical protein
VSLSRTKRRAIKARDKVYAIRREWMGWQGKYPDVVRVNHGDYLALTECNWISDGRLSGTEIKVEPG